jgi:uncharacterized repeat protein (TIGR03803 family)
MQLHRYTRGRFVRTALLAFGIGLTSAGAATGAPASRVSTVANSIAAAPPYVRAFAFAGGAGGAAPKGALVGDGTGAWYGVAAGDEVACSQSEFGECGLVFKLTPAYSHYVETVLYAFGGIVSNGQTVSTLPNGTLAIDRNGVLYGTTASGGAAGYGSVFSLTPASGAYVEADIYDFQNASDGAYPNGSLVVDAAGALYGTTQTTAFKLTPAGPGYAVSTLHRFRDKALDGTAPGPLVVDAAGTMFGTTASGGSGPCKSGKKVTGCGTIFALVATPDGYHERVLYSFPGGSAGAYPTSLLIRESGGALYGTTQSGGNAHCACGVAFKLVPSANGTTYSVLYAFEGTGFKGGDGANPVAFGGLVADGYGTLYGETSLGGMLDRGTIFRLTRSPQGGYVESVIHRFTNHAGDLGPSPSGALAVSPTNALFGMTEAGGVGPCFFGNGCGLVFKMQP